VTGPRDALELARQAALAELRRSPVARPWQRQAAAVVALWLGVSVVGAAAALVAALARPADLAVHAPLLAAVLVVAAVGGVASLAPRVRPWAAFTVAVVLPTMAALVASRGAGLPSATPEWVCSATHLAIGSLPLAAGLWALRQCAWTWRRALATGLGAGTAGAFLGELVCHRGARHVLVYHLGAWLVVALACVLISRRLRSRTYAP
jgi:hypothetical protein